LWDFGDGTQDTARNTTHTYTSSGGYVVELNLFDSLGCRNSSFISQRVRVSPPPSFELLNALDSTFCAGDTLVIRSSIDPNDPNTDLLARAATARFLPVPFRRDTIFLPDGVGVAYTSSLTFNQFRPGAILESADQLLGILVSIEHSYARDISIDIRCPDGTQINLLNASANLASTNLGQPFACGPIDDNTANPTPGIPFDYTFVNDSPANGTIDANDAVFVTYPPSSDCPMGYSDRVLPAGEYEPLTPLSALEGCPLNGEWTIRIQDNLPADNGWLFGWGLTVVDSLYRTLESFTPPIVDYGWREHPTSISPNPNQFTATSSFAGDVSYTFWVEDDFGCVNDTTLNFAILPPTDPACSNCELDFGD
ncbi:MAG: PKD domain-containing protein, partial [Bacteroidetes bacterium]